MEVLYPCCGGLDVHKKSITACVLWAGAKGQHRKTKRRFGTLTEELLKLSDWLRECGVTHIAMESTGVYWKPVWNILEGQFEKVLLVNAQHPMPSGARSSGASSGSAISLPWPRSLSQRESFRRSDANQAPPGARRGRYPPVIMDGRSARRSLRKKSGAHARNSSSGVIPVATAIDTMQLARAA